MAKAFQTRPLIVLLFGRVLRAERTELKAQPTKTSALLKSVDDESNNGRAGPDKFGEFRSFLQAIPSDQPFFFSSQAPIMVRIFKKKEGAKILMCIQTCRAFKLFFLLRTSQCKTCIKTILKYVEDTTSLSLVQII